MSRIVLSRYETGQQKFVVGWDHPCGGAFWQEFGLEPANYDYPDNWKEVIRSGGMWHGIPLYLFKQQVPEDLRPMVTEEVMNLLFVHAEDPDSGYKKIVVDLSDRS